MNPKRRGFTITESIVVFSVSTVLAAQLLPAIQEAREAARRAQCKNNLKQIGLALHNYHDVFSTFPPGWTAHYPHAVSPPRFGWQTMVLPFVDQAVLYNQLPVDQLEMPSADNKLLQTVVPTYRCPSDRTQPVNSIRAKYATSNYSGNHGNQALPRWAPGGLNEFWPGGVDTPVKANGMFYWNSVVRFRDVLDGTSNTFLVGERGLKSGAGIWPGVRSNRHENDQVTDCGFGNEINSAFAAFSSLHPGGAHFLLGDGAVRFVSEKLQSKPNDSVEMGVFQKLGQRNDGFPVP